MKMNEEQYEKAECFVILFSAYYDTVTLRHLCVNNTAVVDFAPLGTCEKLTVLEASGTGMCELSLPETTALKELDVSDNQISDISPLSGYGRLTSLDVSRNQLTSLRGLEHAIYLENLEAADNGMLEIIGIDNCTVLETVNLNGNKISDIYLLHKSAATLKNLYLSNNYVNDISPLAHTTALEHLNLDYTAVDTLWPLVESSNLISLSANCIGFLDIDGLENAVKLKYLYLSHNWLSEWDLSPITELLSKSKETIRVLDLSWNVIYTLDFLSTGEEPHEIETLALCGNRLASLEEVKKITGTHLLFSYDNISYADGMDLEGLSDVYDRFTVLDCSLDKQVATKDVLNNVTFATDKEAAEAIWKTREFDDGFSWSQPETE